MDMNMHFYNIPIKFWWTLVLQTKRFEDFFKEDIFISNVGVFRIFKTNERVDVCRKEYRKWTVCLKLSARKKVRIRRFVGKASRSPIVKKIATRISRL